MLEPLTIHLRYFALLREQRGVAEETLSTHALTAAALYMELAETYGFSLPPEQIKVAKGERFASMDAVLEAGDSITFIPPVAGG